MYQMVRKCCRGRYPVNSGYQAYLLMDNVLSINILCVGGCARYLPVVVSFPVIVSFSFLGQPIMQHFWGDLCLSSDTFSSFLSEVDKVKSVVAFNCFKMIQQSRRSIQLFQDDPAKPSLFHL